jgi:hypothetical protein
MPFRILTIPFEPDKGPFFKLVLLPSTVVQYPGLIDKPISTVAISIPSLTLFTPFVLSSLIISPPCLWSE